MKLQGKPVENPFYVLDLTTSSEYREFGVGDMAVSPDGQWNVFSQFYDALNVENGTYGHDLYLQHVEGGSAQPFLDYDEENANGFMIDSWFVKP